MGALPQTATQSTPAAARSLFTVAETCALLPTSMEVGGAWLMATEMSGVCSAAFFAAFVLHPAISKKATRASAHSRNALILAPPEECRTTRGPLTKPCLTDGLCTRETEHAWLRCRRFMSLMPFPNIVPGFE